MLLHKGTFQHPNVWRWTAGASVFMKLLVESLTPSCREPDGPLQSCCRQKHCLHVTRTSVCCHQLEACCSASSPAGSTWTQEQVCSTSLMTYASSQKFGHTCFFFSFKTFYSVGMLKTDWIYKQDVWINVEERGKKLNTWMCYVIDMFYEQWPF